MRYVEFLLIPRERHLHPADAAIAAAPAVEREAIHHFSVVGDGTAVVLMEFTGDADRLAELTGDDPDVLSYDLSTAGDRTLVYSRITADEDLLGLYRIPARHDVVLGTPMRYTDRGALRARAIGTQGDIAAAVQDIPEGLTPKFISTGDYDPERPALGDALTERQREILRVAIGMGYYEEPRETNYEALADALDLSSGTVGEHLRKIESTVLKRVLP